MAKKQQAAPNDLTFSHFTIDYGFKATVGKEVEYEGQHGLMLEGYATEFNVVDQEHEWTTPDSFKDAARTFFDNSHGNGPLPIMYHHGLDRTIKTTRLGRVVDHRIDNVGVWVKAFLPRPGGPMDAVGRKIREVYGDIKNGKINGFSIGGVFGKFGRAIKSVALYEISVTPTQCLDTATFTIAGKSLPAVHEAAQGIVTVDRADLTPDLVLDLLVRGIKGKSDNSDESSSTNSGCGLCDCAGCTGKTELGGKSSDDDDDQPFSPDGEMGKGDGRPQWGLSRKGHSAALKIAAKDQSISLHDHLLDHNNYPVAAQGEHSPDNCPICDNRRQMMGIKATISDKDWSKKNVAKLPKESFLVVGDAAHPATWAYPVFEGKGDPDSDGLYTERGPLNKRAVKLAYKRAIKSADKVALEAIKPYYDLCDLNVEIGKKVKPLHPKDVPATMTTLAVLAMRLDDLMDQLPPADGNETQMIQSIDGKAGKVLSGLSLQSLRAFATTVIDAGQSLHAWLDKYDAQQAQLAAAAESTAPSKKKGKGATASTASTAPADDDD